MVNELQARLHSLYAARVQLAQVGPQMAGLERYRIIASGEQLYTLLEAADRIAELEACVLEYWNAKDWDAIGAADCTAAKLLPADMRSRADCATQDRTGEP